MATNTHGSNYISSIKLPNNAIYKIHDEDAIHNIEDLGLSTPLNFKGTVDTFDELPTLQTLVKSAELTLTENQPLRLTNIDLSEYTLPLQVIYSESRGTYTNIIQVDEIITALGSSWTSTTHFKSLFNNDYTNVALNWYKSDKEILFESGATEVPCDVTPDPNTHATFTIYEQHIQNGDVYLVSGTGQEYVAIRKVGDNGYSQLYWEPLGNVHDAASSKHIHNVQVSIQGQNSPSDVTCSAITIPTYAAESYSTNPFSAGKAATWEAKVQNGVLSFTWTANTPSSFAYDGLVKTITPGSTSSGPITGTAKAQTWIEQELTVTVSGPVEPTT